MKPKIFQMMDCSTGHLSLTTREWLDKEETRETHGFMSRDTGYAISTWLGDEEIWPNHPEIPKDLIHVLRFANANGMDWVLFDTDAEQDVNLPWYEDMSGKPDMPEGMGPQDLSFPDGISPWHIDPAKISPASLHVSGDQELEDEHYLIPENRGAWIGVSGAALRIKDTDGHLAVTVFVDGFEMDDPLSETVHTREEIDQAREDLESETPDGPGA